MAEVGLTRQNSFDLKGKRHGSMQMQCKGVVAKSHPPPTAVMSKEETRMYLEQSLSSDALLLGNFLPPKIGELIQLRRKEKRDSVVLNLRLYGNRAKALEELGRPAAVKAKDDVPALAVEESDLLRTYFEGLTQTGGKNGDVSALRVKMSVAHASLGTGELVAEVWSQQSRAERIRRPSFAPGLEECLAHLYAGRTAAIKEEDETQNGLEEKLKLAVLSQLAALANSEAKTMLASSLGKEVDAVADNGCVVLFPKEKSDASDRLIQIRELPSAMVRNNRYTFLPQKERQPAGSGLEICIIKKTRTEAPTARKHGSLLRGVKHQRVQSKNLSTEERLDEIVCGGNAIPQKMQVPPADDPASLCKLLEDVALVPYQSSKPVSAIVVEHIDFTHLQTHPINKLLACVNQFVAAAYRMKDPAAVDRKLVARLAHVLAIPISLPKNIDPGDFQRLIRAKETIALVKDRLMRVLNAVVTQENGLAPSLPAGRFQSYKFSVRSANNGTLVKTVLKQRWWWISGDKDDEGISLHWTQWCKRPLLQGLRKKTEVASPEEKGVRLYNHLEGHFHLSNKKAMFINMRQYYLFAGQDPFKTLPLTFHIKNGTSDPEFQRFAAYYQSLEERHKDFVAKKKASREKGATPPEKNVWIVKPGENSNRGHGVQVFHDLREIEQAVNGGLVAAPAAPGESTKRTYILQKYIERPLLINKRKFDIRMFGMITSINGLIKGYFYDEGYIRTSSKEFTLKNLSNKTIHLTNDAVQKRTEDYGKYESGNKLSLGDMQKYLDSTYAELNIDFYRDILPQIKVRLR